MRIPFTRRNTIVASADNHCEHVAHRFPCYLRWGYIAPNGEWGANAACNACAETVLASGRVEPEPASVSLLGDMDYARTKLARLALAGTSRTASDRLLIDALTIHTVTSLTLVLEEDTSGPLSTLYLDSRGQTVSQISNVTIIRLNPIFSDTLIGFSHSLEKCLNLKTPPITVISSRNSR